MFTGFEVEDEFFQEKEVANGFFTLHRSRARGWLREVWVQVVRQVVGEDSHRAAPGKNSGACSGKRERHRFCTERGQMSRKKRGHNG